MSAGGHCRAKGMMLFCEDVNWYDTFVSGNDPQTEVLHAAEAVMAENVSEMMKPDGTLLTHGGLGPTNQRGYVPIFTDRKAGSGR